MSDLFRPWTLGLRGAAGLVGSVIGLVIVYFGLGIGTEAPKKEATASVKPVTATGKPRPVLAMNLALGNMVFLAHELGFSVKNGKSESVDASRIATRIESQLQGVRELYREEAISDPGLAGSMTLQFEIASSGEVGELRESSSRLNNPAFRKAVIAQVAKWSFAELLDGSTLTVTCPLLFVQEGMDITTLVRWEKTLGHSGDSATPAQQAVKAPEARTAAMEPSTKSKAVPAKALAIQPLEPREVHIKYPTSLRKHPNFNSPSLLMFTNGTKVTVVGKQGEWLEVRTNNGPTGFIRTEFVGPAEFARK